MQSLEETFQDQWGLMDDKERQATCDCILEHLAQACSNNTADYAEKALLSRLSVGWVEVTPSLPLACSSQGTCWVLVLDSSASACIWSVHRHGVCCVALAVAASAGSMHVNIWLQHSPRPPSLLSPTNLFAQGLKLGIWPSFVNDIYMACQASKLPCRDSKALLGLLRKEVSACM